VFPDGNRLKNLSGDAGRAKYPPGSVRTFLIRQLYWVFEVNFSKISRTNIYESCPGPD
jgi:hypothetical protein